MEKVVYSLTVVSILLAGMFAGSCLAAEKVIVIPLNIKIEGPPASVARTGQAPTIPFTAPVGSDGALQKGTDWPNPRFTGNGDGTVTDNLTGLTWLQNTNCTDAVGAVDKSSGIQTWANALTWSNNLAAGDCDLSDSSIAGDWRLPNVQELQSLIAYQYNQPALSNDAGTGQWTSGTDSSFSDVKQIYWTSTTYSLVTEDAWAVSVAVGRVEAGDNGSSAGKSAALYVWPVRD